MFSELPDDEEIPNECQVLKQEDFIDQKEPVPQHTPQAEPEN
jgi:hypothetical protein